MPVTYQPPQRSANGVAGSTLALPEPAVRAPATDLPDLADIKAEIAKRHDEAVKRLQDWIALPSIATFLGAVAAPPRSLHPLALRLDVMGWTLEEVLRRRTSVVSKFVLHHVKAWGNAPAGSPAL